MLSEFARQLLGLGVKPKKKKQSKRQGRNYSARPNGVSERLRIENEKARAKLTQAYGKLSRNIHY